MRLPFLFLLAAASLAAQPTVDAVTNAADFTGRVSPGSFVTLFGTNFTTSAGVGATSTPLSTTLNQVTVYVNNVPAPLLYVDATQINLQLPYETPVGAVTLFIQSATGASADVPINVYESSPAIFQYGLNLAFAVDYTSGVLNSITDPVNSGDYLIVYVNGIGPITNQPADGDVSTVLANATDSFSASIGGVNAPVTFLGLSPGSVGLGQANIQVPALANGNYPLAITVNGLTSVSAIVSVAGPGTPPPSILTLLSSTGVPTASLQSDTHGTTNVQLNGTNAYVCDANQISVLDVSNPSAPTYTGSFGAAQLNATGSYCTISQQYLVETINARSFDIYDLLTSPSNPQLVAGPVNLQVPISGFMTFEGNTGVFTTTSASWSTSSLQILSEGGSVETYDFSNFTAPVYDATFAPPSGFTDDTAPRFQAADLNNTNVVVLGTTNTGQAAPSGEGQFTVLDLTNPANPQGVTEVLVPQTVVLQSIAVDNNIALISGNTQAWNNPIFYSGQTPEFLNDGQLTLSLVDFTNVAAPAVLSTTLTGYQASGPSDVATLGGGFFAIAIAPPVSDFQGAGTLAVVDARNTSAPVIYPIAVVNGISSLYVSGGYLYAVTTAGLNIYQVTLPTS